MEPLAAGPEPAAPLFQPRSEPKSSPPPPEDQPLPDMDAPAPFNREDALATLLTTIGNKIISARKFLIQIQWLTEKQAIEDLSDGHLQELIHRLSGFMAKVNAIHEETANV